MLKTWQNGSPFVQWQPRPQGLQAAAALRSSAIHALLVDASLPALIQKFTVMADKMA